jgi:hypothetical protein
MWIYCASALREHATDKLFEKVAAHRAELEKLAQTRQAREENGGRAHRQGQE